MVGGTRECASVALALCMGETAAGRRDVVPVGYYTDPGLTESHRFWRCGGRCVIFTAQCKANRA